LRSFLFSSRSARRSTQSCFFGVPGFDQLHTPFRWVFPYTLSIAVLAGIGANILASHKSDFEKWIARFALVPTWAGIGILMALAASWVLRDQTIAFADRILRSSNLAKPRSTAGECFIRTNSATSHSSPCF